MLREENIGPVRAQEGLEKVQEDLREVLVSCGSLGADEIEARCAQLYNSGRVVQGTP